MRPSSAVAVIATFLAASFPHPHSGPAGFVGAIELPRDLGPGFGGLSALELSPDGMNFVTLSDRGNMFQGTFRREGGQFVGVTVANARRLRDTKGDMIEAEVLDPEGLAVRADGTVFVSFEKLNEVGAYGRESVAQIALPTSPDFSDLGPNKGLEALAIDDQGRLYTMPEKAPHGGPYPLWRLESGKWSVLDTLPRKGGFLPVGADFGPDGRFYLLERAFGLDGFRSRVRSFQVSDAGLSDELHILQTDRHRFGNLEGLAVWRAPSGAIRLSMVSDDNFASFLPSEIVEFELPLAEGREKH